MLGKHIWSACAVMLLLCGLGRAADTTAIRIEGAKGALTVDGQGISLRPASSACPAIKATGDAAWAVLLHPDMAPPVEGPVVALKSVGQTAVSEPVGGGVRLTYRTLTDGKRVWQVGLTLEIRPRGDAFEVTGEVRNDERGWVVCGFAGPVLSGIQADLATHPAMLADGYGRRISRAPDEKGKGWKARESGFEITAQYPSRQGTMQWSALAGEKGGLYFGCHDVKHGGKTFGVRYDPASKTVGLAVVHQAFCAAGKTWAVPPTVVLPYEGSWHAAARHYRAWADTVQSPCAVPAWTRNASGWLLAILKQQNGEVLWDYSSLGALCDVADRRGLDILGLFGWAHGGHDHLYPDYFPDPKMGGEEALRKALKEVRRRGKRSILYANGQLQEMGTEFWERQGKDLTILGKDGQPVRQTYHKYRNIPVYPFGLGCLVAPKWYERMLSLAIQANDLGADGILYDQLGVSPAMACYAAGHGHAVPAMVYAEDRVKFLRRIQAHMKGINPEFIVMTEGIHDSVLDSISLFHGCMLGMFPVTPQEIVARGTNEAGCAAFPEMFRYTFPDAMTTVRVPTPMMDRAMVNYTAAYGLRHEIESRYAPDVRYLREGKVPQVSEYEQVINRPDIKLMQTVPQEEAVGYLKRVVEFQRANADLLWRGRYVDTEGFALEGKGLVAKGYAAGDRLGVLVWNPGDQAAPVAVRVPGASLVSASEPGTGAVAADSPLAPQSIRLQVWKK